MSAPNQLLWTIIGLLLTIGGTFVEAFATNVPWNWAERGVQIYSLNVSFQIGAVLLAGCLGGKNAGALSQIAYIILGLTGLQVFNEGGGLEYLTELSFGYLLGFIPGAWICGYFAFQTKPRLESLAFSCLCGLLTIHISGLTYLIVLYVVSPAGSIETGLWEAMLNYSVYLLPGQLVVICAVTVVAFFLRKVMFY
ncbi:MAG: biotin transporter BioY [Oscillatoria sp. PMC 1051.18]|nr:biotin transporter BioY [Oscillatoria sp. PMC 1050.18]MEC5032194.1 biotin transporter BioY [Oscillatoria sp. PMC 1051.18]